MTSQSEDQAERREMRREIAALRARLAEVERERDAVTIDRDAHRDRSAAQEETIRLLRGRVAEVERERDVLRAEVQTEMDKTIRAHHDLRNAKAERDERTSFAAAETEHANKWAQRCDSLREQVAMMATERDDARRVAKRLAQALEKTISHKDNVKFFVAKWLRESMGTALAYEVEP